MEEKTVYGVVYCLTSPSGKRYIGKTCNFKQRIKEYKFAKGKGQPKIYNALVKYGFDAFKIGILSECEDEAELNFMEEWFISLHVTIKNGYNCRTGGEGGRHSVETRKKISDSNKGKLIVEETRKKISLANRGKKRTKEQKENYGLFWTGKKHTEEAKKDIREKAISRKACQGSKNPKFDPTIRRFSRVDDSEIFEGTSYDFKQKYGLKDRVTWGLLHNLKTSMGWKLLPQKPLE